MNQEFLRRLDKARECATTPFVVSSGFRCKIHNKKVGGSETSSHLKGLAADIEAKSSGQRYKIIMGLIVAGLNRIGIGKNFIHADYDQTKSQEVIWTYYNKTI